MKKKELSIIIVAFNSQDTIAGCLNSVIETVKATDFQIIISDNSENNDTGKIVKEKFGNDKRVIYLKNDKNYGFSKGNNIALKNSDAEFVLFLNPDTKIYDLTIDGMMEFIKKTPGCGVATCFIELPDGRLDDSSHRGFPTPIRSFAHFSGLSKIFKRNKILGGYNLSFLDISKAHEIESAAGSFMLVPKSVGDEISWWDEDYFFYGEDLDFCYRVKEKGYSVWFVPEFKALHMKGISSGIKKISKESTKASSSTKKLATYHRFRAMEIFYDKHYKSKYPKAVNFLVKLGIKLKKTI